MAHNLLRLAGFFDEDTYRDLALKMIRRMWEAIGKYPSSFARWAQAGLHLSTSGFEIAVVGTGAKEMAIAINSRFIPNKLLMAAERGKEHFPILAGKKGGSQALIYVCEHYACRKPVNNLEEMDKIVSP